MGIPRNKFFGLIVSFVWMEQDKFEEIKGICGGIFVVR
jgi:hypothetical protein